MSEQDGWCVSVLGDENQLFDGRATGIVVGVDVGGGGSL
jgi:hypothetical protein